jgi:hypothetical protein
MLSKVETTTGTPETCATLKSSWSSSVSGGLSTKRGVAACPASRSSSAVVRS